MQRFTVEKTKATPKIDFDPERNVLLIEGESYPENTLNFYDPVINWLREYIEQLNNDANNDAVLKINLSYLNTSSTKCLLNIIEMLEDANSDGKNIVLNWYYDRENESMLECAEEFQEDVEFPFNIIPIDINEQ